MSKVNTRQEVYTVIDGERNYQDNLGCDRTELCELPPEQRIRGVAEYAVMMDVYLQRAKNAWTNSAGAIGALHEIRKVAALAVACMEDNGALSRSNNNPTPKDLRDFNSSV